MARRSKEGFERPLHSVGSGPVRIPETLTSRPMGSLYRKKNKSGRRSDVWWVKYYVNGRPVRESTKISADTKTPPAEARRFLKQREGAAAQGAPIPPRLDRITYDELAADLRRFYATTGRRRLEDVDDRLAHLDR